MKTSEFIKKVEGMGYKVEKVDNISIAIGLDIGGFGNLTLAKVGLGSKNVLTTNNSTSIDEILFDLVVEYAKTPIEDREEPKLYYVRLKLPDIITDYRDSNYLTLGGECVFISSRHSNNSYKTKHTEKWLRKKGVWDNPDWEIVEVIKDE